MKFFYVASFILINTLANASTEASLICRNDRRLENGPLVELILTQAENGYQIQSQYIPSLHSPDYKMEQWAQALECKIDARANLAFCVNQEENIQATFKERREFFFDSLEEADKKKSTRYIDILVKNNDVEHAISFDASHCQAIGS